MCMYMHQAMRRKTRASLALVVKNTYKADASKSLVIWIFARSFLCASLCGSSEKSKIFG